MPRPLVIAHTESSLGWGGQEIRVLTEMRVLRRRGHRLLLAAPTESQIFERAQTEGFPVHALETGRVQYPATILALARWLRREKVDVLNTHSSRDGWIAGLAGRLARVPYLLRTRHIEVDYPNRILSRLAFRHLADHILTTSERIRVRLLKELELPPSHATCLPTGQDLSRFQPGPSGVLHQELNRPPSTQFIGMISVLRSWKGHEIFLTAAAELHRQFPHLHFVIAGDGPMRTLIFDMIASRHLEDCVTLIGHREDVPSVLASLTILVLPSTAHEGIPQIILQAQAMGKAIVGSRVGGLPEVIEDGRTGLLVSPGDPSALVNAISRLLQDPAWALTLGRQAQEQAQANYGEEIMADRLETLYFSVCTTGELAGRRFLTTRS
jgi:glycosyltransferase involved in cell wall biosynthesis